MSKEVSPQVCPYWTVKHVAEITYRVIEEREDFQIGEDGKVERVSLGEFDLVKEIQSHNGEVGLINALKLAEARGIDVSTFSKTEPGIMADYSDIDTLDDLLKAKADADAKLASIADAYGLTVEQLAQVLKTGDLSSLKEKGAKGLASEGE